MQDLGDALVGLLRAVGPVLLRHQPLLAVLCWIAVALLVGRALYVILLRVLAGSTRAGRHREKGRHEKDEPTKSPDLTEGTHE